jgi:hypothetical protein
MADPLTPEEASDRVKKALEDAVSIAEGIRSARAIPARVVHQAGQEILVAHCPVCNTEAALSGEGKHLCRTCHIWLDYRREE